MACFLLTASGTAILINCIGIFIKPVSSLLGFNRGSFALFYTFSSIATMLFCPLMGSLLKKIDVRKVVVICSLGASGALFLYSRCSQLWQFYIVGIICGIFTSGLTSMMISFVISNWFIKKRGVALGIAFAGSGLGSMILNPLVSKTIEGYGWRAGYVLLAVVLSAVNIPTAIILLRGTPSDIGILPYGESENIAVHASKVHGWKREEAIKLPAFWMLGCTVFLSGVIGTGVQQHINAYLTDMNYSSDFAATIFALMMAVLIIGKIVLGWVFDSKGVKAGITTICVLFAISMIVFINVKIPGFPYLFSLLFGFAYTILSIPPSYMTVELLGNEDYSANYGVISMLLSAGMSIGSPISATIHDLTGSYMSAWLLYIIAVVLVYLFSYKSIKDFETLKMQGRIRRNFNGLSEF